MAKNRKSSPREGRLPGSLDRYLGAVRRRVRSLQVLRGVFAAGTVVVCALLLAMAAHAVFAPEAWMVRWAISLALGGAGAWAVWRFLVQPLRRPIDDARLARVLDARHPDQEERLSSAVDFSKRGDKNIATEVLSDADGPILRRAPEAHREFGSNYLARPLLLVLGPLVLLGGIIAVWPHQGGRLVVRSVNPAAKIGNVLAPRMQIDPGTTWIPEGDPVTIALRFYHKAADSAVLTRIRGEGVDAIVTEEPMELVEVDKEAGYARFELRFPAVEEGFRYRIQSRRGISDIYQLDVRPYPELESLTAELYPPAYTGSENQTVEDVVKDGLRVLEGSSIRLQGMVSVPLQAASLALASGGQLTTEPRNRDGRTQVTWNLKADADLRGEATAVLEDDHELRAKVAGIPIEVIPDMPPGVAVLHPEERFQRVEYGDEVEVQFEAHDDFGAPNARLVVNRPGQERFERPVARPVDGEITQWQAGAKIAASLAGDVKGTVQMTAWLEVDDNRAGGYGGVQTAVSDPILIEVLERGWKERIQQAKDRKNGMDLVTKAIEELKRTKPYTKRLEMWLAASGQPLGSSYLRSQQSYQAKMNQVDQLLREASKLFSTAGEDETKKTVDGVRMRDIHPGREAGEAMVSAPTAAQRLRGALDAGREVDEAIKALGGSLENQLTKEEMEELMALLAQQQEQMAEQLQSPQEGDPPQQSLIQEQMDLAKLLESLREMAPP